MLACWRMGAVALPCNTQLRRNDLELRAATANPSLCVGEEALLGELPGRRRVHDPGRGRRRARRGPPAGDAGRGRATSIPRTRADRLHLGNDGRAARRRCTRSATCPDSAPRPSTGSAPGATSSSGARPRPAGRSRRATSSSRRGSAAPRRCSSRAASIPRERLELIERERVNVLCQAPTEYRVLAKRTELRPLASLRRLVSAGEALNPEVIDALRERSGSRSPTGTARPRPASSTGNLVGDRDPRRARWAGRCPASSCGSSTSVLEVRAASCPTFFSRYLGGEPFAGEWWSTGDVVARRRRRLPLVRGPRRRPDRLRRLPDRPVRGRVGAAHPPGRRRGGGGRRARPRARLGRPRDRRRCATASRPRSSRASSRSTSRRPPRPTSTRGSSSSPTSCRRPRAARSSAPSCAARRRAGGPPPSGGPPRVVPPGGG